MIYLNVPKNERLLNFPATVQRDNHPPRRLDVVEGAYGRGCLRVSIHLVGEDPLVGGAAVRVYGSLASAHPNGILWYNIRS